MCLLFIQPAFQSLYQPGIPVRPNGRIKKPDQGGRDVKTIQNVCSKRVLVCIKKFFRV